MSDRDRIYIVFDNSYSIWPVLKFFWYLFVLMFILMMISALANFIFDPQTYVLIRKNPMNLLRLLMDFAFLYLAVRHLYNRWQDGD